MVGYWLFYAFSAGIVQTVPAGINAITSLKEVGLSNPYFVGGFTNSHDAYYSGWIWFPTGHLQVTLLLGTTVFSAVLAVLFGLNMFLMAHSFKLRYLSAGSRAKNRNPGSGSKKLGLGFLGIMPALFAGGMPCCTVPIGTLLLTVIFPASSIALNVAAIRYSFLINFMTAALMVVPLLYLPRKLLRLQSGSCSSFSNYN